MEEGKSNFQYESRREFDADLSPENLVNVEAAEQRGLTYDSTQRAYVDEDGCLIRDEFGQEF